MAIDLVTKFQPYVDEQFKNESKRDLLTNQDFTWEGAHTIKIYKISTSPMNDYDRGWEKKEENWSRFGPVAGLDARIEYVPEHIRKAAFEEHGEGLKGAAEAIWQFNVGLIDALCDVVPSVKPQTAYYENMGWRGMEML